MNELAGQLAKRIASDGPLSMADYMSEALGHPHLGYYMSGDPLGRGGDFVTAPEISQVFGELVGLWCAVTWTGMGAPDPVRLVELGPGRGTLMSDALRAAAGVPGFVQALDPYLVEISPSLRAAQRENLAQAPVRPQWVDHFAQVPDGPLLVVANEFFDALPIRQLVRTEEGWSERLVGVDPATGGLAYVLSQPTAWAESLVPEWLRGAAPGETVEIRPAAEALVEAISQAIAAAGGAALLIDYGPAESAPGDSFQAVRGHKYCDPLADPGKADLTAHVDFQALARIAGRARLSVFGPLEQGDFLQTLGIGARTERLCAGAPEDAARVLRGASNRLIAPAEMGSLFKVLALAHGDQPVPAGFEAAGS